MKNRLREIRKELGLSQEGLAQKAGLSRATIIAVESGNAPPKGETVAALVRATGKTATEIFFDFDVV
jgi:putative transcriptional regulator